MGDITWLCGNKWFSYTSWFATRSLHITFLKTIENNLLTTLEKMFQYICWSFKPASLQVQVLEVLDFVNRQRAW